jgi:hypothetical protein
MVLLSLSLIAAVGILAYRRFGVFGATLTLAAAAFDPLLLGHGHLVTTDVPLAAAMLGSVWSFVRFLKGPTRGRAVVAVLLFTAAQITKFSAIVLVVLLPAVALFHAWQRSRTPGSAAFSKSGVRHTILLFVVVPTLLILTVYRFGVLRPRDDPRIPRLYAEREAIIATGEINRALPLTKLLVAATSPGTESRAFIDRLATVPIPGYQYLRGQFAVASHSYGGHATYLLGKTGWFGWWYYFPVAFAVKTPSGTLVLTLLLFIVAGLLLRALIRARRVRAFLIHASIESVAFVAVPIAYFLWSTTSHLNLGARHLLPVYPFLWLGIGWLATVPVRPRFSKLWRGVLLTLALSVPATTLLDAPHFIPSFNTFAGGSRTGIRYLADSNVDWGQDLENLAAALKSRGAEQPYVAYFSSLPVDRFIPNARPVPTDEEVARDGLPHGFVAISLNALIDPTVHRQWLHRFQPETVVGNSAAIYRFP